MKEAMEKGWYLIPSEKIIGKKRIPILSSILAIMGFNRTAMIYLYSMINRSYHTPNNIEKMMAYSFPIEHDNFPKPKDYPFYYRLINGWKIEKESLKFLKDGPLFTENSKEVLVHSKVFVKSLLQQLWKIIVAIGVIVGIPGSVITILQCL